jgi:hypothetical protein
VLGHPESTISFAGDGGTITLGSVALPTQALFNALVQPTTLADSTLRLSDVTIPGWSALVTGTITIDHNRDPAQVMSSPGQCSAA